MQPDPNLINLIVGIVGILIGAIGIYIAIRTSREQWQIAERQGAFHKPRIGFAIFNCKLGQGYPDNERWYFIHPGKLEDFAAFPIEFNIYNAGDRITNEIFISIHVPNRIFWKSQLDGMESVTFPSLSDKDIQQSVDEIGNNAEAAQAIDAIHRFRQKSHAFVITNAVKIEGIADIESLPDTFEAAKKFDVMEFVYGQLNEAEAEVIRKIIGNME